MAKEFTTKSSTGSFILLIMTLLFAIIFMVLFLHFVDKDNKAKPLTSEITKTTESTTTKKIDPVFNASLNTIISSYDFSNNYDYDIYYNGAYFHIKCDNYDEMNNICKSNSLTLDAYDTTYGLYTNEDNLINNPNDYYFIVNQEYIIVLDNVSNKSSGKLRIYDTNGKLLKELTNSITSFESNNKFVEKFYPTLEDDELRYYSCSNGMVRIRVINIKDNFEQKSYENVEGSKCFN